MEPIVYQFNTTVEDYREISYFTTFSMRRLQNAAIAVIWAISLVAFVLDLTKVIHLSQVVHLCVLLVTVTVPMLLVSVEVSISRFKKSGQEYLQKKRTVTLDDQGVKYYESGAAAPGYDKWNDFYHIYETKTLFLFYINANKVFAVPKRGQSEKRIDSTRSFLQDKLGKRYVLRCR